MVNRVHRLFQSAGRQIGRLADTGRNTYRRILATTRSRTTKKAAAELRRKEAELAGPPTTPVTERAAEGGGGKTGGRRSQEPGGVRSAPRKAWSLADFPVDPIPGRSRFHDFDIDLRIMRGIAGENFLYCTPIQEKALPAALAGKDLVGRAQTGTGKSAVFLIALFCRLLQDPAKRPPPGKPRALIIAPTRELVIQIAKDGKKLGNFSPLNTVAVYGGADYRQQEELLSTRPCDVVAATPGRLLDFIQRKVLSLENCSILVIDEADRMLDMGFIPDVRRIISRLPDRHERQTMLFSATITDDVRRLADQWCREPLAVEAGEETIDVDRIEQRIYLTTEAEKFTLLYNLAVGAGDGRILVFANMKSEAARLAGRLNASGLRCHLLTGDVPQPKRLARLEDFRSGRNRLLVATDVAGRGIHVDDIKYVVNYTLPYEPEDYVHRIGRTGRAGADGVAVSFACETGSFYLPAIEEFIKRKLPCIVPEEELLNPAPEPVEPAEPERRKQPRRRGGSRRSAGHRRR